MSKPLFLAGLQAQLPPDRLLTAPEDLMVYGQDGTWLCGRPDLVAIPHTTEEVVTVIRWAERHDLPVIPRGAAEDGSCGRRHPAQVNLTNLPFRYILQCRLNY